MDYSYRFPVVRGTQANKEYYIGMVPLRMVSRLFPPDEEYVLPEQRAQRKLNVKRIPAICRYILDNRNTYVFSALAASIDGNFRFVSSSNMADLGVLEVSMDAHFLINDGQHRKAAILSAIEEDSSLLDETISVVFYEDQGLTRSQQMFTDLNKHAVKTSNSISELYDSRDSLAVITRNAIVAVDFLNRYTDKEKDILGKYSSNLFTLSTFYNANKRIVRGQKLTANLEHFLIAYWSAVANSIPPWLDLQKREISKIALRENYIATQSVIIQVLGRLGCCLYAGDYKCMESTVRRLREIDWRRDAAIWRLRTIRGDGRMINSENAIVLTCNALKQHLGIPLDPFEQAKEKDFKKKQHF